MKKSICIITYKYPNEVDPSAFTFVQQLVWSIADLGVHVRVICPLPIDLNLKYNRIPNIVKEKTYNGNTVTVFFPKCFGFGQRDIGPYNTARLTTYFFEKAVDRVIGRWRHKPDILYGHFITPAGIAACVLGKKYEIPAFIAYGESTTWTIDHMGLDRVKRLVSNARGFISVSTENKRILTQLGIANERKIGVFPNGFNPDRFFQMDKLKARERMNLPKDKYIVAFVGHFIERKGITKLVEAVESIPDVYLICAGKGELKPHGQRILFADLVDPDELVYFYNSADIFVLPTLNEGCCNAIIEAMACGLPIISSDLPFNYDILNHKTSILVNPKNVSEIRTAICLVKNSERTRARLIFNSSNISKKLTLINRTKRIMSFIDSRYSK